MLKRTFFLFAQICIFSMLSGQNLVVNSGFEERDKGGKMTAEDGFATNLVRGWYIPTRGSSDYFYSGNDKSVIKMSRYFGGNVKPYGESSFAGFYAVTKGTEYREYVGGTLSQPLTAGTHYKISVALSLGPKSNLCVEELGVFFSKEQTNKTVTQTIGSIPQVSLKIHWSADSLAKWKIITAEFVATGGEKYFIIGNFKKDADTKTQSITSSEKTAFSFAYYYLDNVSVEAVGSSSTSTSISTYIAPGTKLVAQNILFDTNKSDLKAESYPPLYRILAALKAQPNLKVEIEGHTDSVGKIDANQKLSEDRAKAVADFFISNGIDAARITWKGFGSSKPISDENDKNRRVEFIFSE